MQFICQEILFNRKDTTSPGGSGILPLLRWSRLRRSRASVLQLY